MTIAENLLEDALRAARPVTLPLADIGARGLLETLAAHGASFSVSIESLIARIEVEVGNGLVVGARAQRDGATLEGREAYVLLRSIRTGTAAITPKRFLSMANVLEPIGALPDLGRLSSMPPAGPHDTIELELPEARPAVPPPALATEEIDLPPELLAAPPALEPPPPPRRRQRLERRIERPRGEPIARPSRRGWAIAAAILVAVSGLATVAVAALGARAPAIAAPAPIEAPREVVVAVPDLQVEADEEATAEPLGATTHVQARALARDARRLLRQGRPRAALPRARRAARMRRGLPYYQVLLGDALAADGQDAAARRAWRRALRLRPGYRAAVQRLETPRSAS